MISYTLPLRWELAVLIVDFMRMIIWFIFCEPLEA